MFIFQMLGICEGAWKQENICAQILCSNQKCAYVIWLLCIHLDTFVEDVTYFGNDMFKQVQIVKLNAYITASRSCIYLFWIFKLWAEFGFLRLNMLSRLQLEGMNSLFFLTFFLSYFFAYFFSQFPSNPILIFTKR